MKTKRIHCVVVQVPAIAAAEVTEKPLVAAAAGSQAHKPAVHESAARHDDVLLPWADPYILGVIQKLKREAEADRSAGMKLEFDDACFDFDMEIEELLADGYALASAEFGGEEAPEQTADELPAMVRLPR